MKNASMNRQSLVSIFRLMLLVFSILGILFSSLFLVGCGGDEEADNTVSPVSADDKKEVPPVAEVPPEPPPLPDPPAQQQAVPADDEDCQVGDILAPGESCTYPGTNIEFSVLNNGSGRFLFFTAGTGINARNTTINGVLYNFVANKRADGTWVIEEVGGNPVNNPEARCEIPPLNEDWNGEPVLFSIDREGAGAILLSDGKFVVFISKDPTDLPPISVYGGPVQTATKALIQFAGLDALNKGGVAIPDGEITEIEVTDAFVGVIELEENRRILKVKLPEQTGDTIKGRHALTMWLDVTGPCTLDINKVPPALSAELVEYAKDLLDIMRRNPK